MKEWEIGITDNDPSTWEQVQPLWGDEKIVATSQDSFLELMAKLCETAIASRREYAGDSGVRDHLWKLTIKSYKEMVDPTPAYERRMARAMRRDDDDDDDDSDEDSDGDEDGYRGTTVIECPREPRFFGGDDIDYGEDDPYVIPASSKLDVNVFPNGSIMKVTYDYGTTTELYLKVMRVKSTAVRSLLQYFSLEAKASDYIQKMKKVPAYSLPRDKQIDHFYPNFSRAFLGHYVPLFQPDQDEENYNVNTSKKAISSASMGLSSCLRREDDTTFCTMENRTCSADLLFFPGRFEINELLQTGEKAWTPVDPQNDPNGLSDIRYDSICRWGVPPGDDQAYARVEKMRDEMGPWGSKMLLFQVRKQRKVSNKEFQFEKVFPRTYEMLQSGKFRWFQYKKGVLRLLVGRAAGHDHRSFGSDQVLDSFKRDFESFHELLCAVEASWVYKGKPMTADTFIPKFDANLGPSKPFPKEAELVASKKDAVIVSRCQDKRKLVTVLALSEDHGGIPVLYSGHDDGTLTKWNLQDNTEMWSKQIYPNHLDEWEERGRWSFYIKDTPGVAGLVVRPNKKGGGHWLYTWTNGEDNSKPHRLKVWSSDDGSFVKEYYCEVGNDDKGNEATPDISTVVFCPLVVKGILVDAVLVGLHCCCSILNYDEFYNYFNLDHVEENSEGNILPFYEQNNVTCAMDSWRGHAGILRAMAVVQDWFLLSFSIVPGHGCPDAMILWDLRDPGVPLFRLQLWDQSKGMFKQSKTRLYEVCGISVRGSDVLFADEYGHRVATVKVDGEDGSCTLEGYAQTGPIGEANHDYHGRMAMSNSFAAVTNQSDTTVWIFETKANSYHPKLDRQDGNYRDFERCHLESGPEKWLGREIAVAQVELPKFGGNPPSSNPPSSKKQKRESQSGEIIWPGLLSSEDRNGGFGKGGAIALAMRGRNLVTGFSNGTIVNTSLPDRFDNEKWDVSANHLASCGVLPSDEWYCPTLEHEESDVEDSEEASEEDSEEEY